VRRATVADIEAGKINFKIETISAIAEALGAKVELAIKAKS
jgi:DNA-binding XRE family transcriptional regulator